jgi:GT2 family glycosyltransferase
MKIVEINKPYTLAVLLASHNRVRKTISCLKALYSQESLSNCKLDVYLTDDGCTDGTACEVKRLFPMVNLIQGDGQLFWNRGMRRAWEYASSKRDYDFYLWLNDDTYLESFAIEQLIASSNKLKNSAIVVGTTAEVDNPSLLTYGGRDLYDQLVTPSHEEKSCFYFNGNIVLIPRVVFNVVGFNDSKFHHALGDYDYGLRARSLGIASYVSPYILGVCSPNSNIPTWCNPKYALRLRLKYLRSPTGQNPEEFFLYDYRHNGFFSAVYHYLTIHFRLFFPTIWTYLKKK